MNAVLEEGSAGHGGRDEDRVSNQENSMCTGPAKQRR